MTPNKEVTVALALSRKQGQAIKIGEHIIVTIGETRGSYTTVLVEAPRDVPVARIEGENDGNGTSPSKRAGRRRGGKILHRLPAAKGRDGAVAGAEVGTSLGRDASAANTAGNRGCGAAADRQSD